jgi:hypothetical protein
VARYVDAIDLPVSVEEAFDCLADFSPVPAHRALGSAGSPRTAGREEHRGSPRASEEPIRRRHPISKAAKAGEDRVTGVNSGISYETALALADLGAEVVLLCRSRERGEQAAQQIREQTGNRRVFFELLDASDLGSIRAAAAWLSTQAVDVLIHDAGVLPDERLETDDGLELTFATNGVGPFLPTRLLRGNLEKSPDGRVIWVSSGGMYRRRWELCERLSAEPPR